MGNRGRDNAALGTTTPSWRRSPGGRGKVRNAGRMKRLVEFSTEPQKASLSKIFPHAALSAPGCQTIQPDGRIHRPL